MADRVALIGSGEFALAAVLALDSYPFSPGPVGSVDKIRLERVVNVMQQFIAFPKFSIDTMIMPHT